MPEFRRATVSDAAVITYHRQQMFVDAKTASDDVLDEVSRHFHPWVEKMIAEGKYLGWFAADGERVVAGVGMLLLDWPPHPLDPECGQRAYLLNVYVEPGHRRHKLASQLLELAMAEARERRIRVVSLHATDKGRKVYEQMGFDGTNEMLRADGSA